jgi:hypothetical protein
MHGNRIASHYNENRVMICKKIFQARAFTFLLLCTLMPMHSMEQQALEQASTATPWYKNWNVVAAAAAITGATIGATTAYYRLRKKRNNVQAKENAESYESIVIRRKRSKSIPGLDMNDFFEFTATNNSGRILGKMEVEEQKSSSGRQKTEGVIYDVRHINVNEQDRNHGVGRRFMCVIPCFFPKTRKITLYSVVDATGFYEKLDLIGDEDRDFVWLRNAWKRQQQKLLFERLSNDQIRVTMKKAWTVPCILS